MFILSKKMKNTLRLLLPLALLFLTKNLNAQCIADFTSAIPVVSYMPTDFYDQSVVPSGTNVSYSWNINGHASTQQNPSHTFYYNDNGGNTYNVCLTISSAACNDTVCHTVHFPYRSAIDPGVSWVELSRQNNTVSFAPSMTDGFGTQFVNFVNLSGSAPYVFDWDFGDGTTVSLSTQSTISHQYSAPGVYTVSVSGRGAHYGYGVNGNYSDTVQINSLSTGIEEQGLNNISIYPSQTKSYVTIDLRSTNNKRFEMNIVDMKGKTVLSPVQLLSGEIERIDLSGLESQLYIILLQADGELLTKKVMKL